MIKRYLLFLTIYLFCFIGWNPAVAQSITVSVSPWNTLPILKTAYQQKLYLHFDKPYYAAGERMWFRAYLLNANKNTPDTTNTPVYVELINSSDSIISRKKLQCLDGCYNGSFALHELLPEGIYQVRAYTNWMRNAGNGYFYHRQFFIGNSLSSQIKSNIQFTFQSSKKAQAEIKFVQSNAPFAGKNVRYYIQTEEKEVKKKKKKKKEIKILSAETTTNGTIIIDFNPNKIKDKKPSITVFYRDSANDYRRSFAIPNKNDFDVQIFPEGGSIIQGMTNCVGFKAIGSNGLGIDVDGTLFDNDDKKISDFKSTHLGMGKFCYYPDDTHRYYVVFKTAKGEVKKINMPRTEKEGFALAAVQKYGKLLVSIRSPKGRMVNDSLTLLAHVRGTVFYRQPIAGFTPAVVFDIKEVEPGIAHFVLLNKKGEAISERLVFIRSTHAHPDFSIDFYNPVNTKRDKVTCVFQVKDFEGKPIDNGTFSAAITDANVVQSDSTNENIYSSLLVCSDLKGFIEKPGLYFDPRYKNAYEGLDLLMLTQGWRRFDINKAAKGDIDVPEFDMEKAYDVSGQINAGKSDKPLKGIQVLAYAPNIGYINSTETDKEGFFFFKNLAFPENTQFTIQARRKKGAKEDVNILIDRQEFPETEGNIFPAEAVTPVTDTYLQAANEKYYYENGTRTAYSKTRELLAYTPEKQVEETLDPDYDYSNDDFAMEGLPLQNMNYEDITSLLKKLPGLENWNENTQPKTSTNGNPHEEVIVGPKFAIDGNIYSFNEVRNINVKDLESVQISHSKFSKDKKDPLSNTLVKLSFKENNPLSGTTDKQKMVTTMPLGYTSNILFYEPKYEFFSVRERAMPDLRNTISWTPNIRTGATGKGIFSFHMADKMSIYNIVIEGISKSGEPCRFEGKRMLFYKDYIPTIK